MRIAGIFLITAVLLMAAGACSPGTPEQTLQNESASPAAPALESASFQIGREQAIETAARTLPDSIVDRAEISAEVHGWYWEVVFDDLNAEAEELTPWPLKGPPLQPPGIWQTVIITIDGETGELGSINARQVPEPGPYVSRETAVIEAQEVLNRMFADIPPGVTPEPDDLSWIGATNVDAYLSGDIWVVLFWDDDSKDNRFRVWVNAVTGESTRAGRG